MAWTQEFPGALVVGERAERALRLPMGLASPLWPMFGAAAGMGVAYWWMTQWTRAVNVEEFAGLAARRPPAAKPIEILAESEATPPTPEPAAPDVAVETEAVSATLETPVVVETEVATGAEPAPADDLTVMTGIGPKLSAALAERGVTRFAQIAAWTDDDLADVDAALGLKGRAVREAWVAQARRLAASA